MGEKLKLRTFEIAALSICFIAYAQTLPEYKNIPEYRYKRTIESRKRSFFNFMQPIIRTENERVLKQRERFFNLYNKHRRGDRFFFWHRKWFDKMLKEYKIDPSKMESEKAWEQLEMRIDAVPIELALAQSASESAWGMSRFAFLGKSMFGQWIYSSSDGMIPLKRAPGDRHRVARYDNVRLSVRSYLRNLNTHSAYDAFRRLRHQQRQEGKKLDGLILAQGLIKYSQRREEYVEEIRELIRKNKTLMNLD